MTSNRNKTLRLSDSDYADHMALLEDRNIHLGDFFEKIDLVDNGSIDLLIADPPYNLTKKYSSKIYKKQSDSDYIEFTKSWVSKIKTKLKKTASLYVCADWQTSMLIAPILKENFEVKNRITWQREKGRGSKTNWKNGHEDIWFCTVSDNYTFNVESVKLKKKVIAPYKDSSGNPKDWSHGDDGKYRMTHPSNFMSDITIPFWSMVENTPHPTQKSEKLIAKLVLASSNEGDLILDPFLGSGTTLAVCTKLSRKCIGIERELEYAIMASMRYDRALVNPRIQGYEGVFYERNYK